MIKLSQEVREVLGKVRWEMGGHNGKEIGLVNEPDCCTSNYLLGLGIPHRNNSVWFRANDGTTRCSRPLRNALLKACGLKEPR